MRGAHLVHVLACFCMLAILAQAGVHHKSLTAQRGLYLTLELLDQRCPSAIPKFLKNNEQEFGRGTYTTAGYGIGRRHMLEEGQAAFDDHSYAGFAEEETDPYVEGFFGGLRRRLLGGRAQTAAQSITQYLTGVANLATVVEDVGKQRSQICAFALHEVDALCAEAEGPDKGPGVLMPWLEALSCVSLAGGKPEAATLPRGGRN